MKIPRISVVMSVFNGAATLAAAVESVLAQTESDFEFIVIDDASVDESLTILERSATSDPRIRVLRNQANLGLTRSLIAGCATARGRFIARHDAGDLSHPSRLAREAALLDATSDLAFVSCWTEFVGPELEHLYEARGTGLANRPMAVLPRGTETTALLDGPSSHGSVMFRRDAYERAGGYRREFYYGQDWDLWYRLAAHGTFQMCPEVLYRGRIIPESISISARHVQETFSGLLLDAMRARHASQPEEPILARASAIDRTPHGTRRSRADGFYFIGEILRANGDPRARRYLRAAVTAEPLSAKTWFRWLQSLMLPRGFSE